MDTAGREVVSRAVKKLCTQCDKIKKQKSITIIINDIYKLYKIKSETQQNKTKIHNTRTSVAAHIQLKL